jgi:hypothetical protein
MFGDFHHALTSNSNKSIIIECIRGAPLATMCWLVNYYYKNSKSNAKIQICSNPDCR